MTRRRLEADYGGIRHILAAGDALRMDVDAKDTHLHFAAPRRRTWPWVLLAAVGVVLVAVVAFIAGRWL